MNTKFFGHALFELPRPHQLPPVMVNLSKEETLIYRYVCFKKSDRIKRKGEKGETEGGKANMMQEGGRHFSRKGLDAAESPEPRGRKGGQRLAHLRAQAQASSLSPVPTRERDEAALRTRGYRVAHRRALSRPNHHAFHPPGRSLVRGATPNSANAARIG